MTSAYLNCKVCDFLLFISLFYNTKMEQEREEGEMSDDNQMLVDDEETHAIDNNISSTLVCR